MKLSSLGEFGLIQQIRKTAASNSGVVKGIGDDTAVLQFSAKEYLLFTTDMLVENVHFVRDAGGRAIGYKALACNLSDIAAMGGMPTYAVVSFGAPAGAPLRLVKDIFRGINDLARKFNVAIVGGDTVKSRKLAINIALLGRVAKTKLVCRCGARPGDVIFVTGKLGRSLSSGRHLTFIPRLKESGALVTRVKPTAMIDISDGLAADLGHILEESKVGAVLFENFIPRYSGAAVDNALYDGEDFELLFTVPQQSVPTVYRLLGQGFRFYEIGFITEKQNGLRLVSIDGRAKKIAPKGFKHF